MKIFKVKSTLVNRDAVTSTLWSTLQQLVVASSTYFILQGIRLVTEGNVQKGLHYIFAFVFSLILVYLPTTISMMYLQRWRLSSIDSFLKSFIDCNFGKTSLGHSRNKIQIESWITNECFTVYDQATSLLYQLYSTLMNSILNILVIAGTLDIRILYWYIIAGIVLVSSNVLFRSHLVSVSADVQTSRKQLSNTMLAAWDNIFVGNRHNFSNWLNTYETSMLNARTTATRYDLVRSVISSGAVSVALLLVAVGNGIFLHENLRSLPLVASLLITLPRQIQIIQSIFAFFNLKLSWTGTYAQLKELQNATQDSNQDGRSTKYIQFDAIEISNSRPELKSKNFESVKDLLNGEENGRFTIRGRNGAGKSTLLSLLKEDLGDRAFYLPTRFEDLKFESDFLNHSDGHRLLTVFNEITELNEIEYVILDEWDANLDPSNVTSINAAIDRLASRKVVVESRHRA